MGETLGPFDGNFVGDKVGREVGCFVGEFDGNFVGDKVGRLVG